MFYMISFFIFKKYSRNNCVKSLITCFRQETPPGSRPGRAYLIKELDGTCVIAHQREASTVTTELLTRLTWFTLPGFEPATLKSAA